MPDSIKEVLDNFKERKDPRLNECGHDTRFAGLFFLPKQTRGCLACYSEYQAQAIRDALREATTGEFVDRAIRAQEVLEKALAENTE